MRRSPFRVLGSAFRVPSPGRKNACLAFRVLFLVGNVAGPSVAFGTRFAPLDRRGFVRTRAQPGFAVECAP